MTRGRDAVRTWDASPRNVTSRTQGTAGPARPARQAGTGPCSSWTRSTRWRESAGMCRRWRCSALPGWRSPRAEPASRTVADLRPGAPVVALKASAVGICGTSRVGPDNAAAVRLPMRRLARLGHTSVAFLSAPRDLMADPGRLAHFRSTAAELALRPAVVYSVLTIAAVQQAAGGLLPEPGCPDRDHH